MTKPHRLIGWSLVAVFTGLTLWMGIDNEWTDWSRSWTILPVVLILSGVFLIPAILALKGRMQELAGVISGVVAVGLFFLLMSQASAFFRWIEAYEQGSRWVPLVGLLGIVLALLLPSRLHALLKPLLERWMTMGSGPQPVVR